MTKKVLSQRLTEAIEMAVAVHGKQKRKGDGVPYIVHPIAVLYLLTQWGADEDTRIAGLLHDTIEDTPGRTAKETCRRTIKKRFGAHVLKIVESVTEQNRTLPWGQRKAHYLAALRKAPIAALLVCCADKTHNSYCLLEAYREQGEALWSRFNCTKQEKLWFYRSVLDVLEDRLEQRYTRDLREYLNMLL